MSSAGPERRATVLIAVGGFGYAAVKRLLVEAALRGRLCWRDGGERDGGRRLRDLGILALPEFDGVEAERPDGGEGSAALELMRDLDRQIARLAGPEIERGLAEALPPLVAELLSAKERGGEPGAPPLGLDLIVLARPRRAEAVGWLERLLGPALERLAATLGLVRGRQGTDLLTFLQILDFENWWSPEPAARDLREALAAYAGRWRERSRLGEAAFGRIYLIDGRSRDGIKAAPDRVDEVVLFLELLLFEGQRGELQHLYQARRAGEGPIATFGVRAHERSAQLLSRLAAASFALGWLDHLDHGQSDRAADESALDRELAPLSDPVLRERLGLAALAETVEREFRQLGGQLEQLAPTLADWPAQVEQRYRDAAERLESRLQVEIERSLALQSEWLSLFPEALAKAVDQELQGPGQPVSLRVLLGRLDTWRTRMSAGEPAPAGPASGDREAFAGLAGLHRRFESFLLELVDVARLRGFWPLWALALAIGAGPFVLGLLRELPTPDPNASHPFWIHLHQGLTWLASPAALAGLLLAAGGSFGLLRLQPLLGRAADRGRQFFVDRDRGRFAGALRRELARGGGLREPVEQRLGGVAQDVLAGVRGRVARELGTLERRLAERRRELSWLRDQLAELLRVHGFAGSAAGGVVARRRSAVLFTAEDGDDLERWLASNPPVPERFRSWQASETPFAGWNEAYGGVFLQPLEFLDRLSRRFEDPESGGAGLRDDAAEIRRRAERLRAFLDQHRRFGLAFAWRREGTPVEELLCLAPRPWLHLPGVGQQLRALGVAEEKTRELAGSPRLYLLRVQLGIDPDHLLERAG